MNSSQLWCRGIAVVVFALSSLPAAAQSFLVQCPTHTELHPLINATTGLPDKVNGTLPNPHIKCQQLSGGDGFATMGDGTQIYLFAFGPLSGLANMVKAQPGTVTAAEFNQSNLDSTGNVLDVVKIGAPYPGYDFNGAIGLVPDVEGRGSGATLQAQVVTATSIDAIDVLTGGTGYDPATVKVNIPAPGCTVDVDGNPCVTATAVATVVNGVITAVTLTNPGMGYTTSPAVTATGGGVINGHIDPRLVMDVGVLNGNIPAPTIAIDEGDELFLTLTNVGQVMRPDLFEQHTVHFHGYPNASAFYDGVPDASVAINIGGSFTYYYLAPEAGTYMWHCHISPPEHLQMGMVGQIYVRPRQNGAGLNQTLHQALAADQADVGKKCSASDLLCSTQVPPTDNQVKRDPTKLYAYDDGDGTTAYDVEYPIQMHGFDPNFHFVGMTFNPESFADNKDKYFLLNGRSYPDTINPGPMATQASDGVSHFSQPLPTVINIPANGRALLRFSDLNVTEMHTLASLGIRMHVVGLNARLLRDTDGNNTDYFTNSITLGGGESIDVILDATGYAPGQKFYLYSPQLDHLSNDAENFGGMMTEVNICTSVDPTSKKCTI